MPKFDVFKPIYQQFSRFVDRCLKDNKSLLLPEREAWSLKHLEHLKANFIDAPDFAPDLSFEEKLVNQMQSSPSEEWLILADATYIYYLPPRTRSVSYNTKQERINWLLNQAGLSIPSSNPDIWKPLNSGFSRTGIQYNIRYRQLWLIILFAIEIKKRPDSLSQLTDHKYVRHLLQNTLDSIPEKRDRAHDMKHAILHMMFPEYYESIVSSSDKSEIAKTFKNKVPVDLKKDDTVDDIIYKIRTELSKEHDKDDSPFEFYDDNLSYWKYEKSSTNSPANDNPSVANIEDLPTGTAEILSILQRTRNIILYGPPGTGKTYLANHIAEHIANRQTKQKISEEARLQEITSELTFYEVLALSMYLENPTAKHKVSEIFDYPLVRTYFQSRPSPVKYPRNSIWGSLQRNADPKSTTINVSNGSEPYLFNKTESSDWYLIDDGVEYVEQTLEPHIKRYRQEDTPQNVNRFLERITFHQSYAYEDFVEGWRPVSSENEQDGIKYAVSQGVLRRLATRAEADPNNQYILLIDEINRGNIAKILGELITLLEDDKRTGQPNEMTITLPYSGKTFTLPSNLYIIGTMNTADRSIALLDIALRRRFAFVPVMPQPKLLADLIVSTDDVDLNLEKLLEALNQAISERIDRNYQIGHSYFLALKDIPEEDHLQELAYIWNYQIFPLLEEYFYSQRETLHELLSSFMTSSTSDLSNTMSQLSNEDLIYALHKMLENLSQ